MTTRLSRPAPACGNLLVAACLATLLATAALGQTARTQPDPGEPAALPVETLVVQGLRRTVRFHRPEKLAHGPAVVLVLHGSGGDGERIRRFTDSAFERMADREGFIVAYPDALGGQWHDCRSQAPYQAALAGVDDVDFLRAVVRRAAEIAGRAPVGACAVGYSNGGHMVFRLALEAPQEFAGLAAVAAHLPVAEECDCAAAGRPVSILLLSGTEDSINPWSGGPVRPPGGPLLAHVLSAEQTAAHFVELAGIADEPEIDRLPNAVSDDECRGERRVWRAANGHEVALLVIHGGGHTLPGAGTRFPETVVGRICRDFEGAEEVWQFFDRHLQRRRANGVR